LASVKAPVWTFRSQFRAGAFGWRSDLPIKRIKEAVAEIKKAARKDKVLGAEGAVIFLEKVSGALAHVDSSERPPVLMLPKRTEASLALACAVLLPVLDRLTGRLEPRAMLSLPIAEKIAVSPGVSNLALLARNATTWRVLAVGDLPLSAWVRADGFAVLGPECEGLPPGAPLNAQLMSG